VIRSFSTSARSYQCSALVQFDGRLLLDAEAYIKQIKELEKGAKDEYEKAFVQLFEAIAIGDLKGQNAKPFHPQFSASVEGESLPEKPGTLSGSKRVQFILPEVMGPPVNGLFTWTLSPYKPKASVEIVKLEQKGGSPTGDPRKVVFKGGSLVLSAEAVVRPADQAGLMTWEADPIGEVKPSVSSQKLGGGRVRAEIVYAGLPKENAEFGRKLVRAKALDDQDQQPFQAFFDRDGTDNPHGGDWPNWYYYWKQGPVPELERFTYRQDASMGAGYNHNDGSLTVTESAPQVIPGIDTTLHGTDKAFVYHLVRERVEGIKALGAIVRHELKHKELFEASTSPTSDYDHDRVTDVLETAAAGPRLSPFLANTYSVDFTVDQFYKDLGAVKAGDLETHRGQLQVYGDNELLAIVAEKEREVNEDDDWAFPGSQAGGD